MGPIEQRPIRTQEETQPSKKVNEPIRMPSHPWKRKKAA